MPSAPTQSAGQKRKAAITQTNNSRKRQKAQDARAIPVQSADAALSTTGELNVAAFIKARDFEINALEKSLQRSKKGLTTRAFQQVPRAMRRRTASHNVKKVPRRLRRRAEREMKEDNTPTVIARRRIPSRKLRLRLETAKAAQAFNQKSKTVRQRKKNAKTNSKKPNPEDHVNIVRVPRLKKNQLAEPPKATSKFKRRQIRKTWLPTHLWHAKRAHMSKPKEPLWRMAIPISPTAKVYRSVHRSGNSRGCIAWDMSYMSTIGCRGLEPSIEGMLKSLGFTGEDWKGSRYDRWKSGTRSAEGWVFQRDNEKEAIAPVTVVWCPPAAKVFANLGAQTSVESRKSKSKVENRSLFIRVHPSAFHQLWLEVVKVAKMQRPQVLLEDLRFEIGSIDITGPGSTEALLEVLKPSMLAKEENVMIKTWESLAGLTNPATLPANAMMFFDISDPRLRYSPSQIVQPKSEVALNSLNELIVCWPPDKSQEPNGLFSHKVRYLAARSMPSQKSIDRRKAENAPGQMLESKPNDPKIPVLLIASRSPPERGNTQGSWTVMLPWKCVDPVWRSLMYYNMTSGGTPQFGGLDQKRQMRFEQGRAWFPADSSGTDAGQAWERTQGERRFDEWLRRPPSRRIAWDAIDLGGGRKGEHGNGWACDWEFLLAPKSNDADISTAESRARNETTRHITTQGSSPKLFTQRQKKAAKAVAGRRQKETNDRRRNTSSPESEDDDQAPISAELLSSVKIQHIPRILASKILAHKTGLKIPTVPSLITIRIEYLTRGTPNQAARVYRLPSGSSPLSELQRKQWLAVGPQPTTSTEGSVGKQTTNIIQTAFKKDRVNRHNLARIPSALSKDSLTHVLYLPPDAHPDVVAQYGAQSGQISAQAADEVERQRAELQAHQQQLMFPNMTADERANPPPCPDESDLIGFVTTGAYSLAKGRGVAIASVWLQRLMEHWDRGGKDESNKQDEKMKKKREEETKGKTKPRMMTMENEEDRQGEKMKNRERHLCIVRNAGEGVGRLARWELC